MTALDRFLDRLEGTRRSSPVSWVALCPAHEDRHPSLSVREASDGRVLIHCFAGCDPASVCASIGMDLSELFPESDLPLWYEGKSHKPLHRKFMPQDVIAVLARELTFLSVCAADLAKDDRLAAEDQQRLAVASRRFYAAVEAAS